MALSLTLALLFKKAVQVFWASMLSIWMCIKIMQEKRKIIKRTHLCLRREQSFVNSFFTRNITLHSQSGNQESWYWMALYKLLWFIWKKLWIQTKKDEKAKKKIKIVSKKISWLPVCLRQTLFFKFKNLKKLILIFYLFSNFKNFKHLIRLPVCLRQILKFVFLSVCQLQKLNSCFQQQDCTLIQEKRKKVKRTLLCLKEGQVEINTMKNWLPVCLRQILFSNLKNFKPLIRLLAFRCLQQIKQKMQRGLKGLSNADKICFLQIRLSVCLRQTLHFTNLFVSQSQDLILCFQKQSCLNINFSCLQQIICFKNSLQAARFFPIQQLTPSALCFTSKHSF